MRSSEAFFFAHKDMKCTELVMQDHAILRRGLDIVDGMLKKLEDGERIEIADVITVLKFLRLFGDQYHQTVEENALFPALLRAAPEESALRQLVSEHGDERTLVVEIEDALMSRRGMDFFRSSRRLTAILRNHFEQEDTILHDLAEHWLSKEQDDEVVAEFMKHRQRPELYASFPHLERKYAPKPYRDLATRELA
jgi:hemerythrin-like domain-containing protein